MSTTVAKSGWLYRQSSILKKWKRNWFILYTDGYLRYFENDTTLRAKDSLAVPVDVTDILTGQQIAGVQPPIPLSRDNLLQLKLREGGPLTLCAESPDDMKAWHLSLAQARVIQPYRQVYPVNPYNYPIYGIPNVAAGYSNSSPVYVASPQGYTYVPPGQTVIIDRSYRRSNGADLAMGMVAGAALGTMMWTPLWFC